MFSQVSALSAWAVPQRPGVQVAPFSSSDPPGVASCTHTLVADASFVIVTLGQCDHPRVNVRG